MGKIKYFLLTAIALTLFPTASGAKIRVVGNGGGHAEMLFLSALSRLEVTVTPCLRRPALCGLSVEEHKILQQLVDKFYFDTQDAKVEFYSEGESSNDKADTIMVRSSDLYRSGRPRPYQQISRLAYQTWLSQPSVRVKMRADGISNYLAMEMGRDLFEKFRISDQSLPLWRQKAIFHDVGIELADESLQSLFSIELENETIDITPAVEKSLACDSPAQLIHSSETSLEETFLSSLVIWRCGDSLKIGRVNITLPVAELTPDTVNSLKIKVYAVAAVGESGCAKILPIEPRRESL